jgi:DNA-binding Lrp family transcriptional regulator
MTALERLDVRILKELLADGRLNFVDLANTLGLSKDIITQHYSKLKKQGVITGATIQLNYKQLGYQAVATILLNVDSKSLETAFEQLNKIPGVYARREYISNHNLRIISTLKNLEDLSDLKNKIRQQISGISAMSTLIWTDVRNLLENLTLNSLDENHIGSVSTRKINNGLVDVDELDRAIIEELAKDGRAPFSSISKKLDIAVDTVCRRYAKLKENNTIKVIIQIDPLKVGYTAMAEYYLSLQSFEENKQVLDKLSHIADVSYISKISGDYDLIVAALVRDIDHVAEIKDEIYKCALVDRSEVKLLKVLTAWPSRKQNISTF